MFDTLRPSLRDGQTTSSPHAHRRLVLIAVMSVAALACVSLATAPPAAAVDSNLVPCYDNGSPAHRYKVCLNRDGNGLIFASSFADPSVYRDNSGYSRQYVVQYTLLQVWEPVDDLFENYRGETRRKAPPGRLDSRHIPYWEITQRGYHYVRACASVSEIINYGGSTYYTAWVFRCTPYIDIDGP
jgi:hypothetical protein